MKFSIVTPTYNSEAYIRETIESVLSQEGDFTIEYIIMDGGSTDSTVVIAESYKKQLEKEGGRISMHIFSEKDAGMYDAINKGFARATGDVYAWINSDDYYEHGALDAMKNVFEKFPAVEWVKGITTVIDTDKRETGSYAYIYNQKWIELGIYGRNAPFIHQDSVFWRKSLWEKSGGLNATYRYAGDYALWISFAKHALLWTLNRRISFFRTRDGQLSGNMSAYRHEQKIISPEPRLFSKHISFINMLLIKQVKIFFWICNHSPAWLTPLLRLKYMFGFFHKNTAYIDATFTIKKSNYYKIQV